MTSTTPTTYTITQTGVYRLSSGRGDTYWFTAGTVIPTTD